VHNGAAGGGMVTRSIVSGNSAEITITNGNGVTDNPTISLTTSNLTSLRGVTANGFLAHTATNTITPRSIVIASGSTGLSITNGNGVLDNPTLTLSSTSSAVNSSLVARDSSGNFAANTITGTNFRASQGVPNSSDSSTVGYAFGADGDTGLFSPIVGSGGAANGVLGLYTNNTERIRIDSIGVGIGKNPTTALDVNGTITATAFSGNASTATTLATGRTISLTGDVTYTSPLFNGGGNVTAAATIANDVVTFAKMQNSAAGLSVVGRSTNSAGDFAEITAGTDGHVLRRSGTSIGWGTIVNSATTATSANTANAIVARDADGGFEAGVIVADYLEVMSDLYVLGNLNVNGTTTTLNSNSLTIDDKNIELGSVSGISSVTGTITDTATTTTITGLSSTTGMIPGQTLTKTAGTGVFGGVTTITSINSATAITITSTTANTAGPITFNVGGATNVTADGGGITLKGATDKTFNWVSSTAAWTSSEDLNLASGKVYKINGTSVLSATGLGSGVTSSSLTSVGTITSGTWSGSFGAVSGANLTNLTAGNLSGTIPSAVLANSGVWTSSEDLNLASGKVYKINGTTVLSATGLGSGVTSSSLTSVGTLTGGTWNGTIINPTYGGTGINNGTRTLTINTGNLTFTAQTAGSSVTVPSSGTLTVGADTHFIGTTSVALNRASGNLALTGISSVTLPGSTSGSVQIIPVAAAGTGTVLTLPATTGIVVTTGDTGSVTSTMIAGSIADSKLSTISTSGKVANSATTATSANTANAIVARDASGNFTAGSITTNSDSFVNGVRVGKGAGTGNQNVAVGGNALYSNTTGSNNNAVGGDALYSNTTGWSNTAVGRRSLFSNTTGTRNNAVGSDALFSNTTGWFNNAFGFNALYSNTTGTNNTAFGETVLYSNTTGSNNTAVGRGALYLNTTGTFNNAFGYNALYSNTDGDDNTAFGPVALYSNTTGSINNAVGFNALYSNTTGSNNNAVGGDALYSNTTGSNNTAVGNDALYSNTTGYENSAIGAIALHYNTTGSDNTAVGVAALYSNTTGTENNAFGDGALFSNTTGTRNTAFGDEAGSNITTGSNNICIGMLAGASGAGGWNNITTTSNNIIMGNDSITAARCKVAWSTTSDKRDKTSFAPVPHGLQFVNALKPTAYRFKKDRDSEEPQEDSAVRYGFFAQDVLELEGEHPVVIDNSNPDYLAYNESSLIPILVNAIKELSAELKSVKEELAKIK
jgi:hypothetical protein